MQMQNEIVFQIRQNVAPKVHTVHYRAEKEIRPC